MPKLRSFLIGMSPVLSFALLLAVWHHVTSAGLIANYLLPSPLSVFRTLREGLIGGSFWPHIRYTLTSVVSGYALGAAAGVTLGVVIAESRLIERMVFPFIVALQSIPKVALAPLILVWFGFGIASKVALVTLICFFPVLVNTIAGMQRSDGEMVDMCRSFCKSWLFIFFNVKLAAAAGSIFAGLQIAVVMSLIGAVVGEFMASDRGIGFLIGSATASLDVARMFAGVIILAVIGMTGNWLVRAVQRRVVFWEGPPAAHTREV